MVILQFMVRRVTLFIFLLYYSVVSILPGDCLTHRGHLHYLRNHFYLHLSEKYTHSDLNWINFLIAHFWDTSKHRHPHPASHQDLPLYNQTNAQNPVLCTDLEWRLIAPQPGGADYTRVEISGLDRLYPEKIFLPPRV